MTSTKPTPTVPAPSSSSPPCRTIYQILAGQLFDSITRTLIPNQVITVDGDSGLILDVSPQSMARRPEEVLSSLGLKKEDVDVMRINHSHLTVIPGLVDVHVHLFLHPYSETSWEDQLTKESLAERTVRATVHARRTLLAGFTTVRDLGTEGAFDADVGLRKCLSGRNAIIPGPRYYCATRAIISTGSYGPKSSIYPAQEGIDGVKGAEPVDGVADCVREVRRQIGAGADWIKIYADYRVRSRQSDVSSSVSGQSITTFDKPELAAMITAAHRRGVKVAAHANTPEAIEDLLDLDDAVDSIEHGAEMYDPSTRDRSVIRRFLGKGAATTWVPTLAAYYTSSLNASPGIAGNKARNTWERAQDTFAEVLSSGLDRIACGGDTGVFAHGENALELVLMRKLGAGWDRVLGWATYGGWKTVRGMDWEGQKGEKRLKEVENPINVKANARRGQAVELDRDVSFGAIRAGWAADLVAIEGKVDGSVEEFEDALTKGVKFVMKGGKIYKKDGNELLYL